MFRSSALYFINLGSIITHFFTFIFDVVFMDVWSLILDSSETNPFITFLLESGLLNFGYLPEFLSSISLGTFLFSVICIAIIIVYFFIP